MRWNPPIELTPREQKLCARMVKQRRFFRFLRLHRHALFDAAFQDELATMYADTPRGTPPKPPALLAAAVLLQAYTRASDFDAVQAAETDARWQMVLDCLGAEDAPFGETTLVDFRTRLVTSGLYTALLRRTVDLAKATKDFGYKQAAGLRVALDSAPLEGAGKVEDTINLLGHALRLLMQAVAAMLVLTPAEVQAQAGLTVLAAPSTKAGLDQDWDGPDAADAALRALLGEVTRLSTWLATQRRDGLRTRAVAAAQAQLDHVVAQNTAADGAGGRRLAHGVAPDRQISLTDPAMRHGRKSQTERIDGYKRYVAVDVDHDLVVAAGVLPANVAEAQGADKLRPAIEVHGPIGEVLVDRAFLASRLVADVAARGLDRVTCRAVGVQDPYGCYTKRAFAIDLTAQTVRCPAGQLAVIQGDRARFADGTCIACPQRAACQRPGAKHGRAIHIHSQEALVQSLAARQATPAGRAQLRRRTAVEHALARHCRRQGPRARYRGVAKNDFDACRTAAVDNLLTIDRRLRAAGCDTGAIAA